MSRGQAGYNFKGGGLMTNSISNRDVAKAKEILKKSKQEANSISNKDIEKAKKILSMFDKTLSPATLGSKQANPISDKDMKMLEKSYLKVVQIDMSRGQAGYNFKGVF
jgi:hypothetical protein